MRPHSGLGDQDLGGGKCKTTWLEIGLHTGGREGSGVEELSLKIDQNSRIDWSQPN